MSFKRTPGLFLRTPGSFLRASGSFKRTPGPSKEPGSFKRTRVFGHGLLGFGEEAEEVAGGMVPTVAVAAASSAQAASDDSEDEPWVVYHHTGIYNFSAPTSAEHPLQEHPALEVGPPGPCAEVLSAAESLRRDPLLASHLGDLLELHTDGESVVWPPGWSLRLFVLAAELCERLVLAERAGLQLA